MKAKVPFKLPKKQEQAMYDEIEKQVVEREKQYDMDYDAAIAWVLHKYYDFDALQLLIFRRLLADETKRLRGTVLAHGTYPQRAALRQIGYDVAKLAKQDEEREHK